MTPIATFILLVQAVPFWAWMIPTQIPAALHLWRNTPGTPRGWFGFLLGLSTMATLIELFGAGHA